MIGQLFWVFVMVVVALVVALVGAFLQALRAGEGTASFWEWFRTLAVAVFCVLGVVYLGINLAGLYFRATE